MDNFIKSANFKFVSKSIQDDYTYNPTPRNYKYYQICSFVNPWTNKYHIKRFIINEKNQFVNIQDYRLEKKQYMRFVQACRPNEYKMFNIYDLNETAYPSLGDLTIVQSPILEVNSDYTGYAQF
jgi:hypothetical protein